MTRTFDPPRLRPGLAASPDAENSDLIVLWDRLRLSHHVMRLPPLEFACVRLIDGKKSLAGIQADIARDANGLVVPMEHLTSLMEQLDSAMFLDTPRFLEFLHAPVREPSCIGCYPAEPDECRRMLGKLFTENNGPGLPEQVAPQNAPITLRAALLPHIDYGRGGATYAWGFKELVEKTSASLFVIIGTSHYSPERFTLTRKDFKTPLGLVRTDQGYIDRLDREYGEGLFDDPFAHLPEHSIELEVLMLQFLYEKVRPIRIVPLVVGSFRDHVESGKSPSESPDVHRMVEAIRKLDRSSSEPICYVISGDLAHIGPKFDDLEPVAEPLLVHSKSQDMQLMDALSVADRQRYFDVIANEGDARRICGLPPTWTVLDAIQPSRGKLLHYDQYVHPEGFESVSFASVAFYK